MLGNKPLTIDSRPRLSAVIDTINVTRAYRPDTRLLDEFYNKRVRKVINRIVVNETFCGYSVSCKFRMLSVSKLIRDIVLKIVN
jgi:acid phosphatase